MLDGALSRLAVWGGAALARGSGRISQAFKRYLDLLHQRAHNVNHFDLAHNGELFVLKNFHPPQPAILFDVGANTGDWAWHAAQALPTATIHAFEPSPRVFQALTRRLEGAGLGSRFVFNQLGLSDQSGTLSLYEYDDSSIANTFNWHPKRAVSQTSIEVITGQDYCVRHALSRIDFLKIDVEGAEFAVLKGLQPLLREGRIGIIQFEYGAFASQLRILVRDFFDLLGPDYQIGVLYPNRVVFGPYSFLLERHGFVNFLAVHRQAVTFLRGRAAPKS